MAENTLPKKNTAYTFYVVLVDTGSRPDFKANPTLATGDVQVSTDGAGFGNLGTLPVVTPASGVAVKVDLSAAEMNGDNVMVKFIDAAGAEWDDLAIEIRPATRKAEDLAWPTTSGRSLDITATGAAGLDWGNVENPTTAVDLSATDIQLCDTTTANSDMRGTDSAALATALATAQTDLDTITGADGVNLLSATQASIDAIETDTADMQPLIEKMAYVGARGLGVWIDDAAANTNTVLGTDGTPDNPVSTIAAATTLASALGSQRFYLFNDTAITLAQIYEGYEFIGIGEIIANSVNYGSQDVDNSVFYNLLLTGAQGGTGRCQAEGCGLSAITGMEVTALGCLIAAGTLTLRDDCVFDSCWSAVAGTGTPILDINSVASVNVYFRHYSGGLQINNAVSTTVMSYESDGQIIIGATCTSLSIAVRGNCTITDNGTTTSLTQDAAVNRTNINAECDTAISDAALATAAAVADVPTVAEFNARTLVAASYFDPASDTVANVTTVSTYTGDTPQTGDNFARIGAAGAGLTALPWNAAWDAEVESEVNDALDTAIAELGVGAPAATPTIRTGLMLLYHALAFKAVVQTSGVDALELYNSSGTLIAKKLLTDDGSDYEEARSVSG